MLTTHAHDIRAPLTGVEEKRECQASTRADRVPPLELLDFALAPGVMSVRFDDDRLNVAGRIVCAQPCLDCVLHHHAQHLLQTVRTPWSSRRHQLDDVLSLQGRRSLIAMLPTEAVDDATVNRLRAWLQRTEAERIVITDCEGAHRARSYARASDVHWLTGQRLLISGHKLRRPRKTGQGRPLEAGAPKVPAWLAVSVDEALHEFRWPAH